MFCNGQVNHLNLIDYGFHLLKTKLRRKCPKNKQELKTAAAEAWQSITRDQTQRLVMSMGSDFRLSLTAKDLQQSIKK